MVLLHRYFLLYVGCAIVLGVPSWLVWFREPFTVTVHEFDFFLGLLAGEAGVTADSTLMLGKGIHFLLIVLMGWAYYRLVVQLSEHAEQLRWRDILVPSALLLGACFLYLPWHSPDVFFYFGTGWAETHHGINPYRATIADVRAHESDPAFENVLPAWKLIITPYGPLFVKFIGGVTQLARGDERLALLLAKGAFAVFHLLNGWLVGGIARRLGFRPRLTALLYLTNPGVLLNYVGWAHNDVLMMSAVLAAVWAALADRAALATLFLGLGAGLKYVPLLFFPLLLLYLLRGRPLRAALPRALGLGLLLAAVVLTPYALYDNGLWNFGRLFRGQDQLLRNFLYLVALGFAAPPGADAATLAAALQSVKLVLKVAFLGVAALLAYRLWRRGGTATPDHVCASAVVLLLVYFAVGSPEIHEWYVGWFLCFVFWVNDRVYFNFGMVLSTLLNAVAIYEVRAPALVVNLAWQSCFLALWLGLYYLLRRTAPRPPSPLLGADVA